jgi:cellobiose phosphorylase
LGNRNRYSFANGEWYNFGMEISNLELSPAQREAVSGQPGGLVYIADRATGKVYILCEQGKLPDLEEEYIREGLEMAREQILQGQTSTATVQEIIAKAERRPVA